MQWQPRPYRLRHVQRRRDDRPRGEHLHHGQRPRAPELVARHRASALLCELPDLVYHGDAPCVDRHRVQVHPEEQRPGHLGV